MRGLRDLHEIVSGGAAISVQTQTPGDIKAQVYIKQCGETMNVTERVSRTSWLLGSFVTQMAYIDCETNLRNLCKRKKTETWRRYCSSLTYITRLSDI
jgi:hypothetical protein